MPFRAICIGFVLCFPLCFGVRAADAVVLTEKDSGHEIALTVGQAATLELVSNRTTGYGWTVVQADDSVLAKVAAPEYKPDPAPAGVVGSGGKDTFQIKAAQAGKTTLKFEYRRSFEKDVKAAQTVSIDFVVK